MILNWLLKKFIFRPVALKADHVFDFLTDFSELKFYPEPGVLLSGLHFKVKHPKGILIYFHGNKGSLERWGPIASELLRYNYDVIAMDYRGYGKSSGQVSEENLYSDALFCYQKLMDSLKPLKVILYGRSLGTGVASWLAKDINPSMLILETPFYAMDEVIGQYLPTSLCKLSNYKFNSHQNLKDSKFPIYIVHGTKDRIVPFSSGKKLAKNLKNSNVQFIQIDGGKHNNLCSFDHYWMSLGQFIETHEH